MMNGGAIRWMRSMRRIPWGQWSLFAAAIALGPARAGEVLDRIAKSGTVVLAHREASIPFSYLDEEGKPIGYSVDICLRLVEAFKSALKRPDLQVRFVQVTSDSRIAVVRDGKADLECGSTTNNAERRKQVAFTVPHFIASARMIVRADSGIVDWTDLRNKTVVTTRGTTNAESIARRSEVRSLHIRLIRAGDHAESFRMVENGKADAFAMDDVLLFGLKASAAHPGAFRVAGEPLTVEPYSIMFSADDRALKSVVDREMARLVEAGELARLYDKWFMRPIPPKNVNLGMPMGRLLRESLRYPSDKVPG
jgi:glutamate/aspartate transport system substrate-binding protein